MELTNKDHKKLIKQIGRLCEKQYRKGVQHGRLVSDNSAFLFRRSGARAGYKWHEHLFPAGGSGRVEDYTGMLIGEAAMSDMEELQRFLTGPAK